MLFPEKGEITHQFYNDSSELFSVIEKNLEQRLGITTQTVIKEARATMNKAILDTLSEELHDTEISFEHRSIAWNYCDAKMRKLEQLLWKENIPYDQFRPMISKVINLYGDLSQDRKNGYEIRQAARQKVTKSHGRFARGVKAVQYRVALDEGMRENYQLERLCRVPASHNDKEILAEAATLRRHVYKAEDGYEMYLASCDSNNFSPARCQFGNGISDTVTKQIEKEFKITCEWPRAIANRLRESLAQNRDMSHS